MAAGATTCRIPGCLPEEQMDTAEHESLFNVGDLRSFTHRVFVKAGLSEADAITETNSLIEANLRGVDTHGITRMLVIYVERLVKGSVKADGRPYVVSESPSTALVDGDNAMGAIVANFAMHTCIAKARDAGSAWVSVRNSNHFGACAYWAMMANREGMVGFATTNGPANMAPWGGVTPFTSTNPLAFAVPAGNGRSIVVDMATSVAAKGKIFLAAKRGKPLPEGWALDKRGRPTTDPRAAIDGLVMPLGGHKGYALALMIDILSGILSGADFGPHVGKLYGDYDRGQNIGHLFGAIDISRFVPLAEFTARADQLADEVRSVELADGVSRVFVPGEIEDEATAKRLKDGIPIPEAVVQDFTKLGNDLGVPFPKPV
jgi:LDH2 family malate/lactate/ureidoglycolate dehydrogenase